MALTLDEWLWRNKITRKAFAEKIGYSPGYIENIVTGTYRMTKKLAKKVREGTKNQVRPRVFKKKRKVAKKKTRPEDIVL